MNPLYAATYKNLLLRPLKQEDLEPMRLARNDVEHTRYLSPIPTITTIMQEAWYHDYLEDEDVLIWALEDTEENFQFVFSLALYNFRENICEVGKSLLIPQFKGRGYGWQGEAMAMYIAFEKLGIEAIDAFVMVENAASVAFSEKIGLEIVKRIQDRFGNESYYYWISKERFLEKRTWLKGVEIFDAV